MRSIITAARFLFTLIAAALIVAAVYVLIRRAEVNGSNALAVLGAAVASIGVIASWHPLKEK
jgi:hypothetical protein